MLSVIPNIHLFWHLRCSGSSYNSKRAWIRCLITRISTFRRWR